MRTAFFDSGLRFDDPNLRWGNPSYLLEVGDPGYVPPPDSPITPKQKHMRRNSYYPLRQSDQSVWLTNFCNKLAGYSVGLGLTAGQLSAAQADCGWLIYVLQSWLPASRAWAMACTDAATAAQTGPGAAAMTLPVFAVPALPAGVVAVLPGALGRLFTLIQLIKDGGKATEAIETDLGTVGSEAAGPDLTILQPALKARATATGVEIDWGWSGYSEFLDALQIEVDRGDTQGWRLLVHDTTPGYKDTAPVPAALTRWTYRAIYIKDDVQVGLWSAPVSVTVPV